MSWAAIFFLVVDALPPARFDFEPPVWRLERAAPYDMGRVCDMPDPKFRLMGCTNGPELRVVIRSDLEGAVYDVVLRHELAHLNGWVHD